MTIYKIRCLHKTEEQDWRDAECVSESKGLVTFCNSIGMRIRLCIALIKFYWKSDLIKDTYVGPPIIEFDFTKKEIVDVTRSLYSIEPVLLTEGLDENGVIHQFGYVISWM